MHNSKDFTVGPRHAYSHVNCLSSAAMAYLATKEESYLAAIKNAYEEILRHHTFATGGYGPAECLFPAEEGYLGDSLKANWDRDKRHESYRNFGDSVCVRDDKWGSCEVSCCSWAVFKLCHYLLMLTGEARFGDWAEKLLYNGCGGQLPITGDGRVMYYADYFINGVFKSVEDGRMHENGCSFEWQCCTGTFPEDVAALCYGPLTLVCDKMTLFEGDIKHPSDWIEPVQKEGYSFAFRTKPGHVKPFAHLTRDFYPYYEVGGEGVVLYVQ